MVGILNINSAMVFGQRQDARAMLVHFLRSLGIKSIRQCKKYPEAKSLIELNSFDIIIFDEDPTAAHAHKENAQSVIDDLRRCGTLDLKTIIIITTPVTTHSHVCNAAESGVDGYLLKPFSLARLHERISLAALRRKEMASVYALIKESRFDDALDECIAKFGARTPFWLYSARIAAEIYLHKGMAVEAQNLYEEIVRHDALPWARIGIGRALAEQGRHDKAIDILDSVAQSEGEHSDAYDLMARIYIEKGDTERALSIYKLAMEATPLSVSRLQRYGFAALYYGDESSGIAALKRSVDVGINSKSFDFQTFFVLARYYGLQGKAEEVTSLLKSALSFRDREMIPSHLASHIISEIEFIQGLTCGEMGVCNEIARKICSEIYSHSFEFWQACNLVSMLSILKSNAVRVPGDVDHVEYLGLRYSHNEFTEKWLMSFLLPGDDWAALLSGSHKRVFDRTGAALRFCIDGKYSEAAMDIVAYAEQIKNARAIDVADRVLQRYGSKIERIDELSARMSSLKRQCDPNVLRRSPGNKHLRHPGGLSLLVSKANSAAG